MKKVVTFALIFTGTVLSVFVINIALFALVPEYHDALSAAVSTSRIPVVDADEIQYEGDDVTTTAPGIVVNREINDITGKEAANDSESERVLTPEDILQEFGNADMTPLSASPNADSKSAEKKAAIIDKEYHEDCGTGEGYWVITYSDGSTVVEQ